VKKIRSQPTPSVDVPLAASRKPRPRLRLVPARSPRPRRDGVVDRARARLAAGYYERPVVRERLVEVLWEELFENA